MRLAVFVVCTFLFSGSVYAQVDSAAKQTPTQSKAAKFLRLQHAEDQGFLMEIVEGVKVGETFLISNELNLGLYIGKTLVTSNIAFVYGDTTLDGKSQRDDIDTKTEASHYGLAYGMKLHRELLPFFFPYLGFSRSQLVSDISENVRVSHEEDSISLPLESYDLSPIQITSIAVGTDFRWHFWKVLTAGAGIGLEIPIYVSNVRYKNSSEGKSSTFVKARDTLEKKLKEPVVHANIHFGFAF